MATNDHCAECGMFVGSGAVYHPFLFCELYRLGHPKPAAYLASYGFVRNEEPDPDPPCGNPACRDSRHDEGALSPERARVVRERGDALAKSRAALTGGGRDG